MGIKIKMIRDGEPHYYYQEPVQAVPEVDPAEGSDLVINGEQLWLKRAMQQLKNEIRRQELETIKRKYLGEH